jgi:hypothetical protein
MIHEQMKDQYDLLILKMNVLNQENFSLKRELYFYQNNSNNNTNINTNYNSNNNNQNINNNKIINNDFNTKEKIYPEKNVNKNINMNNIPKQKINNMKIDIDNNNKDYNQINCYKKVNKLNKEKIERDENKLKNNFKNIEVDIDKNEDKNNEYFNTINNSHRKFIRKINQNDSSGVSALLKNNNNENKKEKTPIRTYKTNKLLKNRDIINDYSFIGNNNDSNININYLNMDTFKNNINQDELTNYRKSSKTNLNSNRKGKISRAKSIDNNNNDSSTYIKIKNKNNQMSLFPSESNLKIERKLEEIEKILIQLQKKRDIYLDEYDKLPEHPKKQKELIEKRETKKIIDELNIAINEYKMKERNLKKLYQPV